MKNRGVLHLFVFGVAMVFLVGVCATHSLAKDKIRIGQAISLSGPQAIGVSIAGGRIYVGEGEPSVQIKVFTPDGKQVLAIGKQGGRPRTGPWVKDGMWNIHGMAVDTEGRLWVAEALYFPKRFSVWNNQTGAFVREFFGSTHYGASGGAINPDDPNIMVGEACEWRLDPATGRVLIKGRERLAHAADGKRDARRDLVALLDQDLRIAAPGQKLRVGLDIADQGEHFLWRIRHQRGAVYGFQVKSACESKRRASR